MDQISQNPPTSTPAAAQPSSQPAISCKCPTINESDWDKKKKVLSKTFYKTFSPRLLYIPFSYAIDLDRASRSALKKGYQIPSNPMVLSSDGMFWGSLMVEVTGAQTGDSNVVNLNQEVYTKVSKRDWKLLKLDIAQLTQELGQPPKEVYCWYTSCPKCKDSKVIKTVLIAVPQAQTPVAAQQSPAQPQPPSAPPAAATPSSAPQPLAQPQPPTSPSAPQPPVTPQT